MSAGGVGRGARLLAAVLVLGLSSTAHGFTIESSLSMGCHERITSEALRSVRVDTPNAGPLPLSANDETLVEDLEFTPDPDMVDLGGATLLMGVRDNDLKGRSSSDLTQLADVHGDPNNQEEHCLRAADQTEPGGSAAAVAACRQFILGRVSEAIAGLDANGKPNDDQRTVLTVHLSLRGQVDAPLPTYYVRMGQALHAIEDSFSHTYRTPDGMQVTVVLNWIALLHGTLVESRDGPAHRDDLDVCTDPDALRATRRRLATAAAAAVLRATLDSQQSPTQKMAAVGAILDTYLTFSPGCSYDNQWCGAPESRYNISLTGCGVVAAGSTGLGLWVALMVMARRGRRKRHSGAALAVVVALLGAGEVRAQEHVDPPPVTNPVVEPGPSDSSQMAWGAYAGVSASADNLAAAVALGLRLRLSRHWALGLDGEWNPWMSLNGPFYHPGVANLYGSAILRLPLAYESFNLRTTASLGGSYALMSLYGVGQGSVGLYAGLSPLGLEWKVSRIFYVIFNPLNFAFPVPQLRGVPLTYPQYRFSIGLETSFTDLLR